MKPDRLQKFSKDKLIEFILRKDERIEFLEKKFARQEKVGQAYFEHKKYNVIFERENE